MDRVLIFAKVPQAGRVKTRLAPVLGDEGAAAIYQCFVRDVVGRVTHEWGERTLLYHDPSEPGELLRELPVELRAQRGADLGVRMQAAFEEQSVAGAERVVIIGCDSPDLPSERIRQAFSALESASLVIGPAVDGGYYLIGARGVPEAILDGIAWGTPQVLQQTLDKAGGKIGDTALLDAWYDVDRPEDLEFLRTHLEFLLRSRGEDRCPHTRPRLSGLLGAT